MKHATVMWAVLTAACGATPSVPATTQPTRPAASRIERIERSLAPPVQVAGEEGRYAIADRMGEDKIAAGSIAVFDNYQLQWTKAYGLADVELGQPATDETIFLAGSISKSVNAL